MTVATTSAEYMYCLTSASYPGMCIVGLTGLEPDRLLDARNELDMPWPFKLEFAKGTSRGTECEAAIHRSLARGGRLVGQSREFFSVGLDEVRDLFVPLDGLWWAPVAESVQPPEVPPAPSAETEAALALPEVAAPAESKVSATFVATVTQPRPKVRTNNICDYFLDGQRIRHRARKTTDMWIGVYDAANRMIIRAGRKYDTLSGFAVAHQIVVRPELKPQANGWEQCEYESLSGEWISTKDIRP